MKIRIRNNIEDTVTLFDTEDGDYTLAEPARREMDAPQITTVELDYEDLRSLSAFDPEQFPVLSFEQEEKEGTLVPNGLGMMFDKSKMLTIIVDAPGSDFPHQPVGVAPDA